MRRLSGKEQYHLHQQDEHLQQKMEQCGILKNFYYRETQSILHEVVR